MQIISSHNILQPLSNKHHWWFKWVQITQYNQNKPFTRWLINQFGITYQFSLFAIAWAVNAH